jgi:signal transduction histidine kinase
MMGQAWMPKPWSEFLIPFSLGLPVVVGIVRGHRGAIFIQTEPGEGTRIRLMFPIEVSLVTV